MTRAASRAKLAAMPDQPKTAKLPHGAMETLRTVRGAVSAGALVVAVVSLVALGFAPFGVHEAMFDLDYAVGVVALRWGGSLALAGLAGGLVALVMTLAIPPRRGFVTPLAALTLAACALAAIGQLRATVAANPPVHDTATDWSEPLLFGPSMTAARGPGANRALPDPRVGIQHVAPRLEGVRVAELNARGCRAAVPAIVVGTVDQAYDRARAALLAQGYTLVTENPAAGRIEATTTTRLLKLVGDVVVRIRPEGAGARIDMRSVSRTGEIDLGENCRRVTRLRQALNS
jgi:fatty-acyl-CoA synthase